MATQSSQGRQPSIVWNFFIPLPASAATNWKRKAECPICRTKLTAESSSGTSHLKRHRCFRESPYAAAPAVAAAPPAPPASLDQDMSIYDDLDLDDIEPLD
jgi:hypothetical protein